MPQSHGTLLVVGSGPGIGSNVAKLFAERGFRKVILSSRNGGRLAKEVEDVKATASSVDVVATTVDLADKTSVKKALGEWEKHLDGAPGLEAVLFNAARVGPSALWEFSEAQVENDLQISVTSLYTIAGWALPKLEETAKSPNARPSLLVTSGGLAKDPYPHVFSLAMCKAAQYNLVWSLWKKYRGLGVHCALLVVQGYVKPEAQVTTPKNIAEKAWGLLEQEKGKFDLEVDIIDPEYKERRRKELEAETKEQ